MKNSGSFLFNSTVSSDIKKALKMNVLGWCHIDTIENIQQFEKYYRNIEKYHVKYFYPIRLSQKREDELLGSTDDTKTQMLQKVGKNKNRPNEKLIQVETWKDEK